MKLFFALFAVAVISGGLLYPSLPSSMPSHWDFRWQPDAFLPKSIALAAIPAIMLWLGLILYNVPNVDRRVRGFSRHYELFIIALMLFLLQLHLEILLSALGMGVPMYLPVSVGAGLVIFALGVLFGNSRRNWFVGVRTPWALSSDESWESTHWLSSRLLMASGLIALGGAIFPEAAIYLILVPLAISAIVSVAYSYYGYKRDGPESAQEAPGTPPHFH